MEEIQVYARLIIIGIFVGALSHYIAKRLKFFLPLRQDAPPPLIKGFDLTIIIALYLCITLILAPYIFSFILTFIRIFKYSLIHQPVFEIALFQLVSYILIYAFLYLYCSKRRGVQFQKIWKDKRIESSYSWDILLGILTFFICFPIIIAADQFSELINFLIFKTEGLEQLAIKFLKMSLGHPVLLTFTIFCVSALAPLIEEILFRGFLQSYLRPYIGPKGAILLSSLFFALFHFSPSQKASNFPIIFTLFCFAIYLGYIYERQRSLIAPIAAHMTFNSISVIRIMFLEG